VTETQFMIDNTHTHTHTYIYIYIYIYIHITTVLKEGWHFVWATRLGYHVTYITINMLATLILHGVLLPAMRYVYNE